MDNPKADPEPHYRQQADRETRHAAGLRSKNQIDLAAMRAISYIPRSIGSWNHQYYYETEDRYGRHISLTGDIIDDMLFTK